MNKFFAILLLCASFNSFAGPVTLNEISEYRETTHWIGGDPITAGGERVTGSVGGIYDPADLYGFRWDGGLFIADTRRDTRYIGYGENYSSDTTLALFDEEGNFIITNDNWFTGVTYAKITLELESGFYYIGVTPSYSDITIDQISDYMRLPTGPSSPYMLNMATSRYGQYGTRSIVNDIIPEQENSTIPEPNILWLFGIGMIGFVLSKHKT